MFNFFRKSSVSLLLSNHGSEYSDNAYIDSYIDSCPVYTATKYISDACSAIPILVKDVKKDQLIYQHPFLDLLKNPNPFTPAIELRSQIFSNYILTGNLYNEVIRANNGTPIEISIKFPQYITIDSDFSDGYADKYTYSENGITRTYTRSKEKLRYIYKADNGNTLYHYKTFNPKNKLLGLSFFGGCIYEIMQYVLSSQHNTSLLRNGARPSGILTYKGNSSLTDEQIESVKNSIENRLKGASNAGNASFLNGDFDWKQLSQSVKDMDFPTLKKSVEEAIFKAVKIPLAMVSPDNMSFANMDASKYLFYDNAVLPLMDNILEFYSETLLKLYPNSENLKLTYDVSNIQCLEARKIDNVTKAYNSGLLSRNEGRALLGYEAFDGGDVFYQPANLTPIGSDSYTQDNRQKKELKRLMSSMKTLDGKNFYSDEEIKKAINE